MPKREHHYWVYILSNRSDTLYIGVTNNIRARVTQHRQQTPGTHTARYKINRLVYFEHFQYVNNAIARERTKTLDASPEDRSHRVHEPNLGRTDAR